MGLSHFQIGSITEITSATGFRERHISSVDFARLIETRARELAAKGHGAGRTLLLARPASIDFYATLLAAWSIDSCVVPCDPALPPAAMRELEGRFTAAASDGAALVLLTSGTTSTPRGIRHGFASVSKKIEVLSETIEPLLVSKTLCALPAHFGHGLICNSLFPLLTGGQLFIADGFSPLLASRLDELIAAHGISFFSSTPLTWNLIESFASAQSKPSLARVHCASAPLGRRQADTMRRWSPKTEFWNVYGLTEFLGWVSGARIESDGTIGDVGRPWGVATRVTNGELELSSSFRAIGLDEWFATRDAAEFVANGHIVLKGRLDFLINKGGAKIHPEEIEQLVSSNAEVAASCCFAVPDDLSGQKVGLAVVPVSKERFSEADLRAWLRARLAPSQVPDCIYVLDDLPKTNRGKTDRQAVMAAARA